MTKRAVPRRTLLGLIQSLNSFALRPIGGTISSDISKSISTDILALTESTAGGDLEAVPHDHLSLENVQRRRPKLRQKPNEEYKLSTLPPVAEGTSSVVAHHGDTEMELNSPAIEPLSVRVSGSLTLNITTSAEPPITSAQNWKGRLHLLACCYCYFLEGWNDGSTGPLLPTIQRFYGLRGLWLSDRQI